MGKILPFRRPKRRWRSSAERRGWRSANPSPRFWPEERVTVRSVARQTVSWLGKLRPFILAGILIGIWPAVDPALVGPPPFLATEPEAIDKTFTRCGPGRGHACVVDGDTFKLGERRIRVIGIDAPETHPARCATEAERGEKATAKLQALLNEGPFEMKAWSHNRRDRYGRELMAITRTRADGSTQSIAADMRESGLARHYTGGFRMGWC